MDVLEAIRERYSVRAYEDRPIPDEALQAILEAARAAPSGNNRQPWKFVVVRDPKARARLAEACCGQKFVAQAPVVIVGVGLTPERVMECGVAGDAVDVAIALDHITLAAVELGLGTCWIGAFDQDAVRQLLGIPPGARVVGILPLGYPASKPYGKTRKPLSEIVYWDGWM
jgi:nitroreductase